MRLLVRNRSGRPTPAPVGLRLCIVRLSVSSLLVCAAGAVACSGKEEPPSRLARVEGFCEIWAEQVCNPTVVRRCAAADVEACRDSQAAFCESLIPAGKYSRDGVDACLTAVTKAYEDGELDSEEAATVLRLEAPCDTIISGSGSAGDPCADTTDCSTRLGLVCIRNSTSAVGVCGEPSIVGGGRACTAPNAVCESGFYCNGDNCVENKTGGQACSDAIPCAERFQCKLVQEPAPPDGGVGSQGEDGGATDPEPTVRSECVAQIATGSPCEADVDCLSGICTKGTNRVCSEVIVLTVSADPTVCENLR